MILRLEAMLNYLQKLGVVEVMEVSARVTHITHAFAKWLELVPSQVTRQGVAVIIIIANKVQNSEGLNYY